MQFLDERIKVSRNLQRFIDTVPVVLINLFNIAKENLKSFLEIYYEIKTNKDVAV